MPCKECQEQARLLGMSAERELALKAKIQAVCKAWALAQKDWSLPHSEALADSIISAERATRG